VDDSLGREGSDETQHVVSPGQVEEQGVSSPDMAGMAVIGGVNLKGVYGPGGEMSAQVAAAAGDE
jgi:hypothetical protein